MKRILVTGGAGFIGSHTVDLLLERGYEVRILDNLSPPVHRVRQLPDYVNPQAEFMMGDVTDPHALGEALRSVDAVIHLAAYQDYLPHFSAFFRVNTVSTALIYELIVHRGYPIQKVVIGSSQAVYGEGKHLCPADGVQYPEPRSVDQLRQGHWELRCPICQQKMVPQATDEAVVKPHNQYAISKYTQELIGLSLGRRYDIPTVSMRYSITQGPRQSFRNAYSGILRIATLRLLNGRPPTIYEDGKQLRDYVYIGDVVRANLVALEDLRVDYQSLNVGGGSVTSVLEYVRLIAAKIGKDIEPSVPGQFRLGDTRHIFSDTTKIQKLGWQATTPLPDIVESYITWVRTRPDLADYSVEAEHEMSQLGVVRPAQAE